MRAGVTIIWDRILSQKNKCFYCGRTFRNQPGRIPTLDHVNPISKGGANGGTNLVLACTKCNLRKGCLSKEEFLSGITTRDGITPIKTRGSKRLYHGDFIKWETDGW